MKMYLPISWTTVPLNQHLGPRKISWRPPILPTYDAHLVYEYDDKNIFQRRLESSETVSNIVTVRKMEAIFAEMNTIETELK